MNNKSRNIQSEYFASKLLAHPNDEHDASLLNLKISIRHKSPVTNLEEVVPRWNMRVGTLLE